MTYQLRAITMADYDEMLAMWKATPGMGLSASDEPCQLRVFLDRNPGLSFAAVDEETGRMAGTVLGGHDGRRGFLYHLAVLPEFRGQGIGEALVQATLSELSKSGIVKCHIFVWADNELGQSFWAAKGWAKRHEFFVFSKNLEEEPSGCQC